MNVLDLIKSRHSSRGPFDPERKIPAEDLVRLLEAARWAPTPHNMQNFQIVVVDDSRVLEALSAMEVTVSEQFVSENFKQLSFSADELRERKTGLLAALFPPSWLRTPGCTPTVAEAHAHSILGAAIRTCAALLVVTYDCRTRAPGSENDALGMMSLGCVLENLWLVAESLGIGLQVESVMSEPKIQSQAQHVLGLPEHFKIGLAARLGYPLERLQYLRVRRDFGDFVYRNQFGRPYPPSIAQASLEEKR